MRRPIILFALLLICYAYLLPRWSDWNQNSRLNLVLAMVDDGTVRIDRYVANTGDYALYEGHTYTDKPPGLSFIALPAYYLLSPLIDLPVISQRIERLSQGAAFGATLNEQGTGLQANKVRFALVQYALTLVAVATPAALLGLLFYAALRRLGLSERAASLGALAYGLGTTAAPYAGSFYSHQLVAALLFGAFYVAWPSPGTAQISSAEDATTKDTKGTKANQTHETGVNLRALRVLRGSIGTPNWQLSGEGGLVRGLLCGLLLGWAVISEYPAAIAAAIIGLYALSRRGWAWAVPLSIGGAIPGLLLITYDLVAFGTIMPVGYAYSALWQDQHQTGFMSLTYPQPAALWGLLFGSFRGLFVRAPWLLLALPGYLVWWRMRGLRAEWWVLALVPLNITLIYGSSGMWWGGHGAGPRYIVPMLPFLALIAAWWVGRSANRALRRGGLALAALSVSLVWAEASAGQFFASDAIRNTWGGYVWPAWASGDIARNLGMALGLDGPWSLLPLLLIVLTGLALLTIERPATQRAAHPKANTF